MSHRTCSFEGCDTPLIKKPGRGRPPKWCDFHRREMKQTRRRAYGPDSLSEVCAHLGCGRPVRARKMCVLHYRRWARAAGVEEPQEWNERRRKNYHKRLERLNHPGADVFDPLTVAERDEWVCGICGEDVDKTLKYPDPMSKTTDHIIPLAKGGLHLLSNVQLAHLACNVRKGDSVQVDAMST